MLADTPHLYRLLRNDLLGHDFRLAKHRQPALAIDAADEFRMGPNLSVNTRIMESTCGTATNRR